VARGKSPHQIIDQPLGNFPVLFFQEPQAVKAAGAVDVAGFQGCAQPQVSLDPVIDASEDLVEQTDTGNRRLMRAPCDRLVRKTCEVHFVSLKRGLVLGVGKR
jgi:hypothetical protein